MMWLVKVIIELPGHESRLLGVVLGQATQVPEQAQMAEELRALLNAVAD